MAEGTNLPAEPVGGKLAALDDIYTTELVEVTEGFTPQVVTMKIGHGQETFSIPGLPAVRELEGVVLAARRVRVFFPRMGNDADTTELLKFTNNRPFCTSADYVRGNLVEPLLGVWPDEPEALPNMLRTKIAEGALSCTDCPLNEWGSEAEVLGSGTGNRKACADIRRLLFWREGLRIPVIIPAPPSSIRAWDTYCSGLAAANRQYRNVITEIGLDHREWEGRKDRNYSVLTFEMSGSITEEMAEELTGIVNLRGEPEPLVKALINIFIGRELTLQDYPANGSEEDDIPQEEDF